MRKAMCLIVMVFLLSVATQSWADDYLKIRHVNEAYEVMGQKQPATEEIVETWLSGNKARMNSGTSSSVILRGDKQVMYMLDHDKRAYAEVPMDLSQAMTGMMGDQGGDQQMAQMMAEMMGAMMKINASVRDTGATKTVNDWNCRVYELNMKMPMGNTVSEICATEDIDVDMSVYHKIGHAMMAGQQGFDDLIKEMEKIKGVSVLTVSKATVMGATIVSREELLEHKKMTPPAGSFDIPEGYTRQDFMGM
ncbi:Domain of unknown function [Desulfonatronum thiosulfatophilum]|uniref:Uncharacterized protein n=1 Tax=Desulfonatronum thiosulfatophilum TaxID=617002 RepID=A0A1G6CHB5_9BACT|nr:DUF4412 domain-containing protein [Desulfonatronum thiosulfatophilum]SDB32142.1 Domain of unknown function [Desulfonatronum thiosulfatophilum]